MRAWKAGLMVILMLVIVGCAKNDKPEEKPKAETKTEAPKAMPVSQPPAQPVPPPPALPEIKPTTPAPVAELELPSVDAFKEYKNWEYVGSLESSQHMGGFVEMYINPAGLESYQSGVLPMPAGAIIVKENYDPDHTMMMALTVMIKMQAGFDPDHGDWAYYKTDPEFNVEASGKVDMCIGCHIGAVDTDFVFLMANKPQPEQAEPGQEQMSEPPQGVEALKGYEAWSYILTLEKSAHMGSKADVYANDFALSAYQAGTLPLPIGAIFLKENRSPEDDSIMAITAMIKMPEGYNPDHGDWAYYKTDPEFNVEAEGKVDMCIGCHTGAQAFDYVFMMNKN